jgi:DNA-binding CsgD family transcriptional regulator
VKTYIRSTYRKIEATSRGQAIIWAVRQGFLTERYDG